MWTITVTSRQNFALVWTNEVNLRRARLVLGWVTVSVFNSRCRAFISVCNQPPSLTQPSISPESVNENKLRLGKKGKVKVKVKVNVDLYSVLSKALRYGMRSEGISQFYLHTPYLLFLFLFRYVTNQPLKANSAFHPSGVGKWIPASAGKAKAGMVHSVSGWTRRVQVKLWDPLRTSAIPERLRGVFTTRRYTNPRLPLPLPLL